jgi:tripartite-type tricarboxylate transporter receptor subunit TctC
MKRAIVAAAIAASVMLAAVAPASAEWPADKPIRVIVGFGAGGGTDIVTRIVAQPLSELLHQTVVIENKPGAGSSIAAAEVARAEKDGYTASMFSAGHTVSAVMVKSVRYDAVKDFAAVALVADSAFVVVARKDFPANDINGLVALARASPGKLNFASVGLGSTQHFAGELLRQMTGIDVKHIPYRGTPAVVTALRAEEVDYAVELVQAVQG